jgi:hypothetical protein
MVERLYKVTCPTNPVIFEVYDYRGKGDPSTIEDVRYHGVCLAILSNGWVDIPSRRPSKRWHEFESLPVFKAPLL